MNVFKASIVADFINYHLGIIFMENNHVLMAIQKLIAADEQRTIILGVSGVPGSGKTYFCQNILAKHFPGIKILPMDGYHIYRKDLDEEGMRRRGAPFTLDQKRLRADLERLKTLKEGSFPRFEHQEKDPVEDQIKVTAADRLVVVEGLYLFLKDWQLLQYFDLKILISRPFDVESLAERHLRSGIVGTLEEGVKRAMENDRLNAEYLMQNSEWEGVIKV